MQSRHELHHHIETALDHSTETVFPPLHYQWPQLGQVLFEREQALTEGGTSHTTSVGTSHAASVGASDTTSVGAAACPCPADQQTLPEQEKKQKREETAQCRHCTVIPCRGGVFA